MEIVQVTGPARFRPRMYRDDPNHPLNGDEATRRAYLQRKRVPPRASLSPEELEVRRAQDRARGARFRERKRGVRPPKEVQFNVRRLSRAKPRTRTHHAIVEAYAAGYRVDDSGGVLSPRGRTRRLGYRVDRQGRRRPTFTVAVSMPEGTPGRRETTGKATYSIPASAFAGYCRYGPLVFELGACISFLDGNSTNLRAGNVVLTDRSGVMAIAQQRIRWPWDVTGGPLAPARKRCIDVPEATIREFRRRVLNEEITVREGAAALGKTYRWGYKVMRNEVYIEAQP